MKSIVTEALFITVREGGTAQDWVLWVATQTIYSLCTYTDVIPVLTVRYKILRQKKR